MLDIKTQLQTNSDNNYKCGAYALQAVLFHYGKELSVDEIWSNIASPRVDGTMYSTTAKLAYYSNAVGIPATIYKSKNILETLDVLDRFEKTAILCIAHKHPGNEYGHFVVYLGKKDGSYCFADPEQTKPRRYSGLEIRDLCRATGSEVTGNIFIAFGGVGVMCECRHCRKQFALVNHNELESSLDSVICYWCDRGYKSNAG